uniref:m7GpppN-mRNA hydrolase NUDT17 n=1 Tax=Pseudonaja textilis TaxID=8673 RepID=A0A670Z7I2_PSETE
AEMIRLTMVLKNKEEGDFFKKYGIYGSWLLFSPFLFQRPPFCPIKHLTAEQRASLPTETRHQGVDVGVAVLLESANQKVLLTRRARMLSLFPNTWVPPGKNQSGGDRLLDAGLRELQEETGLHLKDGQLCWELLALWESVYPPRLSQGLPQRHHIVVYLRLALHESHQQLQVSGARWPRSMTWTGVSLNLTPQQPCQVAWAETEQPKVRPASVT